MDLIVLRGKADRPKEISFKSIGQEEDMWTLLFHSVLSNDKKNNMGYVVYWGDKRHQYLDINYWVIWTESLKKYKPDINTDIIFARGGFKEYIPFLNRYPKAFKIYYGAGVRYIPKDGIKYDLILVDCKDQIPAVKKRHPRTPVDTFFKPAPDNMFYPRKVKKKYDCCFVAVKPGDSRKRVEWVYRTVPKDIRILQLGNKPDFKTPKNVVVKKIQKSMMPEYMSMCRVGIAPYTSDDSGPRVIPEFMALGIPVVGLKDLMYNRGKYGASVITESADCFWSAVRAATKFSPEITTAIRSYYVNNLNTEKAGAYLRDIILRHYNERGSL